MLQSLWNLHFINFMYISGDAFQSYSSKYLLYQCFIISTYQLH